MIILGIETSCDETGVALVRDGEHLLGSSLITQIELHSPYGGVVPELAARQHAETIDIVFRDALEKADVREEQIDAVAVTYGPGLPGALLVGVAFAKSYAYKTGKPLIGVNHLEAHLEAVRLQFSKTLEYPALGMIVSGGHTSLLDIEKPGEYTLIGKTRDDAAGEAYDKVAKLLGLGYPGGPIIDKLAGEGNHKRFKFKKPRFSDDSADFSFSGIKTAVMRLVKETPEAEIDEEFKRDLAASFQYTVVRILRDAMRDAFKLERHKSLIITGGVAVNSALRKALDELGRELNTPVFIPEPKYCTDNGIMVAVLGSRLMKEGKTADLSLDAKPDLKIGETISRTSNRYKK